MAGVMRVAFFVCAVALAAVVAGPAGAALGSPRVTDRGIVASVSPTAIVLTELDGTAVTIRLDAATRVVVNGRPAALADVRPGFVATVAHPAGGPARLIQAVDPAPRARPQLDTGIVQNVTADAIVLTLQDGSTVRIAIDAATRVLVNGSPASIADVKPGSLVSAQHAGTAPARVVRVIARKRP
jgi:hypothetical protein